MKHTNIKILLSLLFLAPFTIIAMNNDDDITCNAQQLAAHAKRVHDAVAKKVLKKYNCANPNFYYEERPDLDDAVGITKFVDLALEASKLTVPGLDLPTSDVNIPRDTHNRLNELARKYLGKSAADTTHPK
jgi:hypothetical protein